MVTELEKWSGRFEFLKTIFSFPNTTVIYRLIYTACSVKEDRVGGVYAEA